MKVALSHTRATRDLSNGDLVSNNWDCIKKIIIRFFIIFISATKPLLIKAAYFTEREGLSLLVSLSTSYRILTKKWNKKNIKIQEIVLFRCVLASLYEGLSVRPSVRRSVGYAIFFKPRKLIRNSMESFEKLRHCSLTAISCKQF